jgi:hypothetical protein
MLDPVLLLTSSDTPRRHNRWLHHRYLILVDFYDLLLADLDRLKLHYDMASAVWRLEDSLQTCWNRLKSSDHRA